MLEKPIYISHGAANLYYFRMKEQFKEQRNRNPLMTSVILNWLKSTTLFLILCSVIAVVAIAASFRGTETTAAIFTSIYFYPIYGLLALNLILCGFDHIRSPRRIGAFVLIHLGILVVVAGASYGHFTQTEGYMTIFQQSSENRISSNGTGKVVETLPFEVRLERFWIQYYDPPEKPELYVLASKGHPGAEGQKADLVMQIKGDGPWEETLGNFHIVVEDIIPHADLAVEESGTPKLVLEMTEGGERLAFPLEMGKPIRVDALNTVFTPKKLFRHAQVIAGSGLTEMSELPGNPALEIEVQSPPDSDPVKKFLFANYPDMAGEMGGHGGGDGTIFFDKMKYRPFYEPPEFTMNVSPSPNGQGRTAVEIRVERGEESSIHWYFPNDPLLPAYQILFDELIIEVRAPSTEHILDFKSKLTIVENGEEVAAKVIEVNHPLTYDGYAFYQSDYDHRGNTYTVLQVVKDPGVWWVMAGFLLILLGVIQKFYLDPIFRAKARKEAA